MRLDAKVVVMTDLRCLSYRQRRVLELHYGLGGEQPRTLKEVGTIFDLTREQIREIESQALDKLRESEGPQSA